MKAALQARPGSPNLAAGGHVHHWRIEEPRGPTSPGRCHECGAFRIFRNSPPPEDLALLEENRGAVTAGPIIVRRDRPEQRRTIQW